MSENEDDSDIIDDDCYETYYEDTDFFHDDNNNNYTTNLNSTDPEQFEYIVNSLQEVQAHFPLMTTTSASSCVYTSSLSAVCSTCFKTQSKFEALTCNHVFCRECWSLYINTKIRCYRCSNIECMKCNVSAPESFILEHISLDKDKETYKNMILKSLIQDNPQMKLCPGSCQRVFQAVDKPIPGKVECDLCSLRFCFQCLSDYHAPATCDMMKNWFKKCRDDSETAHYISANTKDCPKCKVCIEKNGGCNHMSCFSCTHNFCWICLEDWKTHDNYYQCSKYRTQVEVSLETQQCQTREALKKYLHYYERWDNHQKSLKLEEKTRATLLQKIETNINAQNGTYIDWQYLEKAANTLAKARYTLMYTYPYAYYLEDTVDRNLFENIQAQLEVEIENLSYRIERSTTHNQGDIENQRHVVERRRQTLLMKYFPKPHS